MGCRGAGPQKCKKNGTINQRVSYFWKYNAYSAKCPKMDHPCWPSSWWDEASCGYPMLHRLSHHLGGHAGSWSKWFELPHVIQKYLEASTGIGKVDGAGETEDRYFECIRGWWHRPPCFWAQWPEIHHVEVAHGLHHIGPTHHKDQKYRKQPWLLV